MDEIEQGERREDSTTVHIKEELRLACLVNARLACLQINQRHVQREEGNSQ